MVFSSTVFLFIFLPLVWLLHTVIPKRYIAVKNAILAFASLIFYAYGEPVYILIMLASVTVNFAFALAISRTPDEKRKSLLCGLTVAIDLAALCFFKYVPWLTGVVNDAFSLALPIPDVTIPVGISFYTFQILSYVVDVRTGKTAVQRSYLDLFLYISFFPQLIAGPIVKYGDICAQIAERELTVDKLTRGIRRFVMGLGKKVLISNTAAIVAVEAFSAENPSSLLAFLGAVGYCLQLYFDFSGYSDMAIGLAHMFGFDLLENFNYPYSAVTIRDFWKRWHISLTSWFREYVYFPLGGNRKGRSRTIFNRIAVFFLTGLWHGANFTYILWGLFHGVLMMAEELIGLEKRLTTRLSRVISRVYTLLAVMLGFVVFNSPSLGFAFSYIGRMFSFTGGVSDALAILSPFTLLMLAVGVIFSLPVVPKLRALKEKHAILEPISLVLCLPILALCIMSLAAGSFNPFIYYIF